MNKVITHNLHKWQYVQSNYHPAESEDLWFVCECGAYKREVSQACRSDVIYQLPVEL